MCHRERLDLGGAHRVEIIRHGYLPDHETEPPFVPGRQRIEHVTFTNGLPAFAITNGSPLTACSINRDKWVLAS
jgi:hypothetical protein